MDSGCMARFEAWFEALHSRHPRLLFLALEQYLVRVFSNTPT